MFSFLQEPFAAGKIEFGLFGCVGVAGQTILLKQGLYLLQEQPGPDL